MLCAVPPWRVSIAAEGPAFRTPSFPFKKGANEQRQVMTVAVLAVVLAWSAVLVGLGQLAAVAALLPSLRTSHPADRRRIQRLHRCGRPTRHAGCLAGDPGRERGTGSPRLPAAPAGPGRTRNDPHALLRRRRPLGQDRAAGGGIRPRRRFASARLPDDGRSSSPTRLADRTGVEGRGPGQGRSGHPSDQLRHLREASVVAENTIDQVRARFGAWIIGPATVFRRAS